MKGWRVAFPKGLRRRFLTFVQIVIQRSTG